MNETQATTIVETLADLLWVGRALVMGVGMILGAVVFRVIRDAANRKTFWIALAASSVLYTSDAWALPSGYTSMADWNNDNYPDFQLSDEALFEAIEAHSGWDLGTLSMYYMYSPPPDTTFEEWCASSVGYEPAQLFNQCTFPIEQGACSLGDVPPLQWHTAQCPQGVVWGSGGTEQRNVVYTYTLPGCGQCTQWTVTAEVRATYILEFENGNPLLPGYGYQTPWTALTCSGGCAPCQVGACFWAHGCQDKAWGNVTCVESFLLNAGCSGQLNCGTDSRDCYVCAVSGCSGLDCTECEDPDPDPCYTQCCEIDPVTGNPVIGLDGDCDGICDADEPNGCGCPEQATDADCDGCPNDRDSTPNEAGGACDDPGDCDEGADSDCDGCDDVDEGSNNGNPACSCTVEGGEHDGKTDTDCDGCPDDLDPDNGAPTRGEDCTACAERGGDTDEDGCCDDEDDEPDEPRGEGEDCKGCSTAVMTRLQHIKQDIEAKMMLGSGYEGGEDLFVPVTLDFGSLGGRNLSATFDLQALSVGNQDIDQFAQGWRAAIRRILAGLVYFAAVYKVLHLFQIFG